MKKDVLIFGIRDFAELAWYYFSNDSNYKVVAFVLTEEYMTENKTFRDLPVVPFENIEKFYPVDRYDFFVPMSPVKMNKVRESIYNQVKQKGYKLASYVSSYAKVFSESIGDNCFILEGSVIQPFTTIGNNSIIWNAHIGHHSVIKNNVFVAKSILCGHVIVEDNCFIGAGATIAENRVVKKGTFITMGSALITDTTEWSVFAGNPAMLQKRKSTKMI